MILLNGKEVEFGTFPNRETLFKKDGLKIESMNMVSFKYTNDSDLIKLMFLKNYLDQQGTVNSLTIYYMPYSRNDRSENGSPFTLKYVANFINSLKFDSIEVIEPHSDVTCALLDNATPKYVNYQLINNVIEEVGFNPQTDSIVFPDSTANKRYGNIRVPNQITGIKHRDFATGKITSLELVGEGGNGNTAILVDDLSSFGGTFIMTAKALKEKGFEYIYLLVGHAENSIFKGELFTSGLIDKVFTTNTILDSNWSHDWSRAKFGDKLKVYDIEELLKNG